MNDSTLFSGMYDTLKRNWIILIVMAVIAAVAAMIFSMPTFMPPRFKSTTVVYPSNLFPLSDESETEQMLQLLADDDIKQTVIDSFKLYDRWDLVPGDPEYNYWVNLLYEERVSIGPTRYESVEITCQDEDPKVAKQMCELILAVYNKDLNQTISEKHEEYRAMNQREMNELKFIMDSLESRISTLRSKTGILDFQSQSERYSEGYVRMIERGGSSKSMEKVESMMKELAGQGSEVEVLQAMIEGIQGAYAGLSQKVAVERSKVKTELTYYQMVVKPQQADKKDYPVRWIILVLSVILSVLATAIFLIAKERLLDKKS